MSRGKNNGGFKRGNRTLAWYLDSKLFDGANQERESNTSSPSLNKRKNSFDSESSLNSNGRQPANETEERKRRANKARGNRQRSQNSFNANDQNELNVSGQHSDPIPIGNANNDSLNSSPDQQSNVVLQQQLLALSAQAAVQKENYCYYDPKSDGYFYEYCGSRGWRKRNPKLHGNPPLTVSNKADENVTNSASGPQTIEKKVYVPIPVPVFPNNHSKFFPQAGTSPNIKYYDPTSDGFYYEAASVDGWKKRTPQALHGMDSNSTQRPKVEPSSLFSFPPLGRDLTSQELEELILSKVKSAPKISVPFASIVSKGLKTNVLPQRQQPEPDYPSSSSTVSSSVSDDTTPPPAAGKENHCQQLFAAQTKEPMVGSFDEPYEFYWSDSEKPENQASSVSSMDDCNPLSAYFNEMCLRREAERQKVRVQRPSSLRIQNPQVNSLQNDNRLPRFNVDQFIADLPGNDHGFMNGMYAPFGTDSPRTPFNQSMFTKDSPMFTPVVPKEPTWNRFNAFRQDDKASADLERGLRDIEKIWQSG